MILDQPEPHPLYSSLVAAQDVLLGVEIGIAPIQHQLVHYILVCAALGDSERVRRILKVCWSESKREGAAYELYRLMIRVEDENQSRRIETAARFLSEPLESAGLSLTERRKFLMQALGLLDHRFLGASIAPKLKSSKADLARLIMTVGAFGAEWEENDRKALQKRNSASNRSDFRKPFLKNGGSCDESALQEALKQLMVALKLTAQFQPLVHLPVESEEHRLQTAQAIAGLLVYMTPTDIEKHYETFSPIAERRELAIEVLDILSRRMERNPSDNEVERHGATCKAILSNMDPNFEQLSALKFSESLYAISDGRKKSVEALAQLIEQLPDGALRCRGSVSQIRKALTHG